MSICLSAQWFPLRYDKWYMYYKKTNVCNMIPQALGRHYQIAVYNDTKVHIMHFKIEMTSLLRIAKKI